MQSPQPLGQLILKNLGKKIAKQGFAQTDLLMAWPEIVGAELAPFCRPQALKWPKAGGDGQRSGKLYVQVLSGYQIELSMLVPLMIERISTRMGWRAVESVKIEVAVFEPIVDAAKPRAAQKAPLKAQHKQMLQEVEDEPLKAALTRLGEFVAGDKKR